MKEYKYRGYKEPIIVNDDGIITYKDMEVERYYHGYKTIGMASGFSYNQLSKQHYISEMNRIDEQIRREEYRKEHQEEFDSLTTADEDLDYFFKMLEE